MYDEYSNAQLALDVARTVALSYLGTWYKWAGDDPSGTDCSGLVVSILKSVGILKRKDDYTACGLARKFRDYELTTPVRGALVFYGRRTDLYEEEDSRGLDVRYLHLRITHVEYMLDHIHSIGASGGGSKTLTVQDAIRNNAFVKIRPAEGYLFIVDPFKRKDHV